MTTNNVEFVDDLPGRTVRHRSELVGFADTLRQNPGRWAKYPREYGPEKAKSAYSAASAINHDKFNALSGPDFEATARKEAGVVSVYVRYTGQGEAAPAATPEVAAEPSVSYSYPTEQPAVEYSPTS